LVTKMVIKKRKLVVSVLLGITLGMTAEVNGVEPFFDGRMEIYLLGILFMSQPIIIAMILKVLSFFRIGRGSCGSFEENIKHFSFIICCCLFSVSFGAIETLRCLLKFQMLSFTGMAFCAAGTGLLIGLLFAKTLLRKGQSTRVSASDIS